MLFPYWAHILLTLQVLDHLDTISCQTFYPTQKTDFYTTTQKLRFYDVTVWKKFSPTPGQRGKQVLKENKEPTTPKYRRKIRDIHKRDDSKSFTNSSEYALAIAACINSAVQKLHIPHKFIWLTKDHVNSTLIEYPSLLTLVIANVSDQQNSSDKSHANKTVNKLQSFRIRKLEYNQLIANLKELIEPKEQSHYVYCQSKIKSNHKPAWLGAVAPSSQYIDNFFTLLQYLDSYSEHTFLVGSNTPTLKEKKSLKESNDITELAKEIIYHFNDYTPIFGSPDKLRLLGEETSLLQKYVVENYCAKKRQTPVRSTNYFGWQDSALTNPDRKAGAFVIHIPNNNEFPSLLSFVSFTSFTQSAVSFLKFYRHTFFDTSIELTPDVIISAILPTMTLPPVKKPQMRGSDGHLMAYSRMIRSVHDAKAIQRSKDGSRRHDLINNRDLKKILQDLQSNSALLMQNNTELIPIWNNLTRRIQRLGKSLMTKQLKTLGNTSNTVLLAPSKLLENLKLIGKKFNETKQQLSEIKNQPLGESNDETQIEYDIMKDADGIDVETNCNTANHTQKMFKRNHMSSDIYGDFNKVKDEFNLQGNGTTVFKDSNLPLQIIINRNSGEKTIIQYANWNKNDRSLFLYAPITINSYGSARLSKDSSEDETEIEDLSSTDESSRLARVASNDEYWSNFQQPKIWNIDDIPSKYDWMNEENSDYQLSSKLKSVESSWNPWVPASSSSGLQQNSKEESLKRTKREYRGNASKKQHGKNDESRFRMLKRKGRFGSLARRLLIPHKHKRTRNVANKKKATKVRNGRSLEFMKQKTTPSKKIEKRQIIIPFERPRIRLAQHFADITTPIASYGRKPIPTIASKIFGPNRSDLFSNKRNNGRNSSTPVNPYKDFEDLTKEPKRPMHIRHFRGGHTTPATVPPSPRRKLSQQNGNSSSMSDFAGKSDYIYDIDSSDDDYFYDDEKSEEMVEIKNLLNKFQKLLKILSTTKKKPFIPEPDTQTVAIEPTQIFDYSTSDVTGDEHLSIYPAVEMYYKNKLTTTSSPTSTLPTNPHSPKSKQRPSLTHHNPQIKLQQYAELLKRHKFHQPYNLTKFDPATMTEENRKYWRNRFMPVERIYSKNKQTPYSFQYYIRNEK